MHFSACSGRTVLISALSLLLLVQTINALPEILHQLKSSPHEPWRPGGGISEGLSSGAHLTNRVDFPDGTAVGPRNGGLLGRTFEATAIQLGEKVVPLDTGSGTRAERKLLASYLPDALRFRFHFLWFLFGKIKIMLSTHRGTRATRRCILGCV
jgi:hypothetical protein